MGLPDEATVLPAPEHAPPGFAELYAAQFRFVWSLAARLGVPPSVREDVAQEVWLTVHRRLHTLRPGASTRGWIAAITRKVAARHHRTVHRAERKHLALALVDPQQSIVGERDSFALVDDALSRMDPGQREVFLLAHVEELRGPEIAEALDVPLNTVYSRLRLARARLCEFLAQVEREEQAVLAAIRRRDAPPRGAAHRVWIAVLGELGEAGTAMAVPTAGLSLGSKLALFGASTLVVAAIATGFDDDEAPVHRDVPVVEAVTEASVVTPDVRTVVRSENVPAAAEMSAPAAAPAHAKVSGTTRVARPSPSTGTAVEGAVPADDLAAEAKLLTDAGRALTDGDARRALGLLDDHAQRFPRGGLLVEARALRVRTLCAIGRREDAQRAAADLVAEFPGSPSAAGVRDACGDPR